MQNRILLMNDLPGIGRAALNMMLPILTQMGAEPVCLPTALLSNTLNFGGGDPGYHRVSGAGGREVDRARNRL